MSGKHRPGRTPDPEPRPRVDGSHAATCVLPDGSAVISHEDLIYVLRALDYASARTTVAESVIKWRSIAFKLGDDR